MLSLATAARLGVKNGDVAMTPPRRPRGPAPVWIMPGHADDSVTVHLGYGRRRAGNVGTGIGFNAYAIRSSQLALVWLGARDRKTGDTYSLVTTQHHHIITGKNEKKEEEESVAAARRDLVEGCHPRGVSQEPGFRQGPGRAKRHGPRRCIPATNTRVTPGAWRLI